MTFKFQQLPIEHFELLATKVTKPYHKPIEGQVPKSAPHIMAEKTIRVWSTGGVR